MARTLGIPDITALEMLSEGPFGEGTRWRETRVMFKKEAVEEMWVTGFPPPHDLDSAIVSHSRGCPVAIYSDHSRGG